LYRATDKHAEFEEAVREFAQHLDGAAPVWARLADWGGATMPTQVSKKSSTAATWTSPMVLTLSDMESLRDAMASQPMPWRIDWSGLDVIAPDAMDLLDGLFQSLCEEPVALQFSGVDPVVRALRAITPSGDRSIATAWWQTRLNALRTMQRQDDFELAALDYCITYEVSPPAWQAARCQFAEVDSGDTLTDSQPHAHVDAVNTVPADARPKLEGEVLGDASNLLAVLEMLDVPNTKLVVDCGGLLRVDFAAAGSILNWVAMRQAQGQLVQFHNAHRLVAAFFNVIGINEHAKVIPRAI
jgi:anti-anti-sigma regulatory factor